MYMHAHTHIRACAHTHTHTHTHKYTQTHVHMRTYMHTCTCTHTHARAHTHTTEVEAKGQHDILDYSEVCQRIKCRISDLVKPGHARCISFWGAEETYDHVEFDVGQSVRLKTKGDSPFIGGWALFCGC